MRSEETRELGRLAGRAFDDLVAAIARTHRGVADRAFGLVTPATGGAAAGVKVAHDTISTGVYAAVRGGGRAATLLASHGLALARAGGDPLDSRPRGNLVCSAVNGVVGDRLDAAGSPLAIRMAVRHAGADLPLTPRDLAAAHPDATGDVVVFLHGLTENEDSWRLGAREHHGDPRSSHGSRLRRDLGLSPVWVRYNTGLAVGANGAALARLLEDLVAGWPVPVTSLVLVGHSMGGLVIRRACALSMTAPDGSPAAPPAWLRLVTHCVYLGTPHLGAPLAKGAHLLGRALGALPETRPFRYLVDDLSEGIRDMRLGLQYDLPLVSTCRHHVVSAALGSHVDHPVGWVVGDLLVRAGSAGGRGEGRHRGRLVGFTETDGARLAGMHHFDLLNRPEVYSLLREWLAPTYAGHAAQASAAGA